MIITVSPSIEQIRFHIATALGCFETLSADVAQKQCIGELRAALAYIDALNGADDVVVRNCGRGVPGVHLEVLARYFDLLDAPQVEPVLPSGRTAPNGAEVHAAVSSEDYMRGGCDALTLVRKPDEKFL